MKSKLSACMIALATAAGSSAVAAPANATTVHQPTAASISQVASEAPADSLPDLHHDAARRIPELKAMGFSYDRSEVDEHGRVFDIYRSTESGVAIEYQVLVHSNTKGGSGEWNLEWDWGPRIYMRGSEIWDYTAAAAATAVCARLGLLGGAGCSMAFTIFWPKLKPRVLNDSTCYDLSEFMTSGWSKAPSRKCA